MNNFLLMYENFNAGHVEEGTIFSDYENFEIHPLDNEGYQLGLEIYFKSGYEVAYHLNSFYDICGWSSVPEEYPEYALSLAGSLIETYQRILDAGLNSEWVEPFETVVNEILGLLTSEIDERVESLTTARTEIKNMHL